MIKYIHFTIILFFFAQISTAQQVQKNDYHSPLGIPLILASNFGELRPNHFHMGLDFKTNGRIGYNIYSIEDGFVSRIKISPYGYGKVIYIDHPNGITSVYAHCSEFKGEIAELIKNTQYKEQNYAVEIFPKKNQLSVKRGQVIAISGNTGGSSAPHLHFELRETKTEQALNPLIYGFDIADHKKPEIRNIKVYGLTKDGYRFPTKSKLNTVYKGKTMFYISENKLIVPAHFLSKSGGLGFAFDVIDRFDGAGNKCGLYASYLIIDNDTVFGQKINKVPFESTRYVNSHKDYYEYAHKKRKFHKSFRTNENSLPIYTEEELGVFHSKPGSTHEVQFVAFDAKGNKSILKFKLVILSGEINKMDKIETDSSYLLPNETMLIRKNNTEIEFGRTTTYEPIKIDRSKIEYSIGSPEIPVQKAYKIKISGDFKSNNYYMDITTAKNRHRSILALYDDSLLVFEPKYFGKYSIKKDETNPTVTPINFKNSSTQLNGKVLKWKIADRQTSISDYDLFINGEWVLLEFDAKRATITYTRELSFKGEKELKLIVVDSCGNQTTWTKKLKFN